MHIPMSVHIDHSPLKDCKNPQDSYGMICVKCNQCRRFDDIETPIEKQMREAWERLKDMPAGIPDYRAAAARLTSEELYYCYNMERRKAGFLVLQAEARRRGIEV